MCRVRISLIRLIWSYLHLIIGSVFLVVLTVTVTQPHRGLVILLGLSLKVRPSVGTVDPSLSTQVQGRHLTPFTRLYRYFISSNKYNTLTKFLRYSRSKIYILYYFILNNSIKDLIMYIINILHTIY